MNGTPGTIAEPTADNTCHGNRQENVECQSTETEPQRPVRGYEGNNGVLQPEWREGVEDRSDYVDGKERHGQQRNVAVEPVDDETWPRVKYQYGLGEEPMRINTSSPLPASHQREALGRGGKPVGPAT